MVAVFLEIALASAGIDGAATLYWKHGGKLVRYGTVSSGSIVRQRTWPGHSWVLKGSTSRAVLLRFVAQSAPPIQRIWVDVDDAFQLELAPAAAPTAPAPPAGAERVPHPGARGSRSPSALARRTKLKKERRKAKKLVDAAADAALSLSRGARLRRAEAVAFARGAAAERATARERRGRKRIDKAAGKARAQASKRAARRRKAATM